MIDPNKKMTRISIGWSICDSIVGIQVFDANDERYVNESWLHKSETKQDSEIDEDGGYVTKLMEWVT